MHSFVANVARADSVPAPPIPILTNEQRPVRLTIVQDTDDGTEVDQGCWFPQGFSDSTNYLGADPDMTYRVGLRFCFPPLPTRVPLAYARLLFASHGSELDSTVDLLLEGVLQDSPTTFSEDEPPSLKLPKTQTEITWGIHEPWEVPPADEADTMPLYYSSPNVAPIINEIRSLPNWGGGPEGRTLILTATHAASDPAHSNVVFFEDFYRQAGSDKRTPAILELYVTPYSPFLGRELLGRITDSSATVNVYSLVELDLYVEYGASPGGYSAATAEQLNQPPRQAIDIVLSGLAPDTRYYYRLRYRRSGDATYRCGREHTFHTHRPAGSQFTFAITADEHCPYKLPIGDANADKYALYRQTLSNVASAAPDFLISMGDFAMTDWCEGRWIETYEEAKERYLNPREEGLDAIAHSIPFYLVLGNHEAEVGWDYDFDDPGGNTDSTAVLGTRARKQLIVNPVPDSFYSGNTDVVPEYGLREDYYAWEWGDALFVVLDPYWYTKRQPRAVVPRHIRNNWEWTLGHPQYEWLYQVLHESTARWKFVFIHQLVSSQCYTQANHWYGRGGIEIAKYKVDGGPSFEWGGEDENGDCVFDAKRPGWMHGPIHDMLVAESVDIVFHGHDHFFARQDLDGIIYQECPQATNVEYNYGFKDKGGYKYGVFYPNAGHLEVTVDPASVCVKYLRAYLPGDGETGQVQYTYVLDAESPQLAGDLDRDGDVDLVDLAILLGEYAGGTGGDVDRDGDTDHDDLAILLMNYGSTEPP